MHPVFVLRLRNSCNLLMISIVFQAVTPVKEKRKAEDLTPIKPAAAASVVLSSRRKRKTKNVSDMFTLEHMCSRTWTNNIGST